MNNLSKLFIGFAALLSLSACELPLPTEDQAPTKPPKVATFEDCIEAGYVVTGENPRQCSTGSQLFAEGKGEILPNYESVIKVYNFEECVAAGNEIMESYPRKCHHGDRTFTEDVTTIIPDTQTECAPDHRLVCGEKEVQCIKAPCPPIKETYPNRCEAEKAGAKVISEGFCPGGLPPTPPEPCSFYGGTLVTGTRECEGISKQACDNLNGTYNECASACRNDPDAEICTEQCVQVCEL